MLTIERVFNNLV